MKKKILYLRTYFNFGLKAGGSVGHTAGVINSFREYAEVDVISNDHLPEVKGNIQIVKPFRIKLALVNNILELFYNLKLICKIKNVSSYDAIYHRYTGNSFLAAYFAKKYNIPLILEFNSSVVWAIKHWRIKQNSIKDLIRLAFDMCIRLPMTSIIEKYNLKYASLIVVVSNVLRDSLISRGVDKGKIMVNYNGVDLDKFSNTIDCGKIKSKYNLKNKLVYGFIGTFGQWHGIIELVKAIDHFYEKYPDMSKKVVFLLIGDGVLMKETKRLISNSRFKKNYILSGLINQKDAPLYLNACDVFLSPHIPNPDGTKFFGSPTKLFEYMALNKPIIASRLEQIGEILTHNKTAYLTTPGDIEELSQAIYEIAQDAEMRDRISAHNREIVFNNYTWDKHISRLILRFKEIEKN